MVVVLGALAVIVLWVFQGVPLATTPRRSLRSEMWLALCVASLPMVFVGAYVSSQDLGAAMQLPFMKTSPKLALAVILMTACYLAILVFRLWFAHGRALSPEELEGKRVYVCPLGGFRLTHPSSWRVKRKGPLTYAFAPRKALGVLRMARVYSDSEMGREFHHLTRWAGFEVPQLLMDLRLFHEGRMPFDSEDAAYWARPASGSVQSRAWLLGLGRVLFLFTYRWPEGVDTAEELQAVERTLESIEIL